MDLSTTVISLDSLDEWFTSDVQLHQLYPENIQLKASKHWTPLAVTNKIVEFLVPQNNVKVLDIGSGVGKFCLAGAYYRPTASFYGVEQRVELVSHAEKARDVLGLSNAHFIHDNITQVDFKQYDHFYFYNSFYENLMDTEKIDDTVPCNPHLYNYYYRYLYKKLNDLPTGTRLATFHCIEDKIPSNYFLIEEHIGKLLKYWIKV